MFHRRGADGNSDLDSYSDGSLGNWIAYALRPGNATAADGAMRGRSWRGSFHKGVLSPYGEGVPLSPVDVRAVAPAPPRRLQAPGKLE